MPLGKCKLCLTEGVELLDSHLMPKAGYRLLREDGSPPFVMREVMMFKDEQVHDYLCCASCEDRFNKNGETWVLQHCHREDRQAFALRDLLLATPPFIEDPAVTVFTTANIPSVETAKLVYFASSIFWKASVHEWKTGRELLDAPKLGRYEEAFRLYLLGGPFPAKAWLHLAVINDSRILNIFTMPYQMGGGEFRRTLFWYFGLNFTLWLGNFVPPEIQRTAFFPSRMNPIGMSNAFDSMLMRHAIGQMGRTKRVGSMKAKV